LSLFSSLSFFSLESSFSFLLPLSVGLRPAAEGEREQ